MKKTFEIEKKAFENNFFVEYLLTSFKKTFIIVMVKYLIQGIFGAVVSTLFGKMPPCVANKLQQGDVL